MLRSEVYTNLLDKMHPCIALPYVLQRVLFNLFIRFGYRFALND